MSRLLGIGLALAAALMLAWFSLRPEKTPVPPIAVSRSMPAPDKDKQLWRVMTRRHVWRQGAEELQRLLKAAGLEAFMLVRREAVNVYAFDDARNFPDLKTALAALKEWRKLGFEASLLKADQGFIVSLGRIYIPEHAERRRQRLATAHLPFRFEQRQVVIPVYRLVLPPSKRKVAEENWQRMQNLGIADPVLIAEDQFQQLYGDYAHSRSSETKRSNK